MALPFDPVEEARRNWARHWGDDPVPSMSAVTSIMRVQQILLARLNDTLKPFDLTFPRYEALMLLYYSRQGGVRPRRAAPARPAHDARKHRPPGTRNGRQSDRDPQSDAFRHRAPATAGA